MASTRERILISAQALAQVRGYNGFSYADISAELAITKPSIHHHFASKAELAVALVAQYRKRFELARRPWEDPSLSPREQLTGYAGLYAEVFSDGGRMCLCGVFAADAASLPEPARAATAAFFLDQQRWVTDAFRAAGLATDRAGRAASAYLAALEGALLLARVVRASRAPAAAAPPDARPTQPSAATVVADSAAGLASATSGVSDIAATLLDALL